MSDFLFQRSFVRALGRGRFDLYHFLECASYFPYRYTGANQNRCEGILSVVLANIVAVNCTSFHFLIK